MTETPIELYQQVEYTSGPEPGKESEHVFAIYLGYPSWDFVIVDMLM